MSGVRRTSDLGTQGVKTILDGSVLTADIANGAVTQSKLASSLSGVTVTTSALRATAIPSPFEGQIIYETDTDLNLVYNGSSWVALRTSSGAVVTGSAAAANVTLTINNTATNGYSTLLLGGDNSAGVYRLGSTGSGYSGANSLMMGTVPAYPVSIVTGNTVRLQVDGNGYVVTPYQPVFKAHSSNATVNNNVTMPLNTTTLNVGSCYNTSNYRFTAPVAGTYVFGGLIRVDNDQAYLHLIPYVNGSSSRQNDELPGLIGAGGTGLGFTATPWVYLRYLNASDYIQFNIVWYTGGPYNLQSQTFLYGYLMG